MKSLKELIAQEVNGIDSTAKVDVGPSADVVVPTPELPKIVAPKPEVTKIETPKPKKEKTVTPTPDKSVLIESTTEQKNAFRDNPEAFFGPVIAALVASGVQKDGIRPRAIAAYWNCLDLCDWVKDGGAADAWVLERAYKKADAEQKAKDIECQRVKIEHDKYKSKLVSTDPDAAERPTLTTKVAELRAKYQSLEVESLTLLKQVQELQNKRLVS